MIQTPRPYQEGPLSPEMLRAPMPTRLDLDRPHDLVESNQKLLSEIGVILRTNEPTLDEPFPELDTNPDDTPETMLPPEQEHRLRELALRLGIGAEHDIPSNATCNVLDSGKPWEIIAAYNLASDRTRTAHNDNKAIVFTGSDSRHIGDDEKAFLKARCNLSDTELNALRTERDMATFLAIKTANLEGLEPRDTGVGYATNLGNAVINKETGQLVRLGDRIDDTDTTTIFFLRVDESDTQSGQLDPGGMLEVVDHYFVTKENDPSALVGLITGSQRSSKALDVALAAWENRRPLGFGMYGRDTLRGIAPDETSQEIPLPEVLDEIQRMAEKTELLEQALQKQRQQIS
ncbi:hypothetical protein CR970_03530 [Candidatus Saccharibacteria bacterium]|nr:MAG: hypothetical protein CR970_03530 [Candidatus Saccharibacteria bacterium]